MTETVWTPRMTVSAVIQRDDRFLMVEERNDNGEHVFNQPAGHLEQSESLIAAIEREVLEETGFTFYPSAFTGLYRWEHTQAGLCFMRLNFVGHVDEFPLTNELDKDILATHWMSREQIATCKQRSPLVMRCIEDCLHHPHYPLTALIDT